MLRCVLILIALLLLFDHSRAQDKLLTSFATTLGSSPKLYAHFVRHFRSQYAAAHASAHAPSSSATPLPAAVALGAAGTASARSSFLLSAHTYAALRFDALMTLHDRKTAAPLSSSSAASSAPSDASASHGVLTASHDPIHTYTWCFDASLKENKIDPKIIDKRMWSHCLSCHCLMQPR